MYYFIFLDEIWKADRILHMDFIQIPNFADTYEPGSHGGWRLCTFPANLHAL